MSGPQDEEPKMERELTIPPWDAVSITRRSAERSRAERDAAIADLRDSTSEKQILAEFGIDISQLNG